MTDSQSSTLLYIDTNPIAYAFEGPEELASALKELFSLLGKRPGSAVTSELTLAEVLPKRKIPDRHFLDLLIWSKIFDLRPITRDILLESVKYRRAAGVRRPDGSVAMPKLPDSIHVVTAISSGCVIFLSSDMRLKLPNRMRLVRADLAGIAGLVQELA